MSARINLTDAKIRKTKPAGKEINFVDQTGVICRILVSGRKLFCGRFKRKSGSGFRVNYGDYPDRSLADARTIHLAVKAARKNNRDIEHPLVLNEIIQSVCPSVSGGVDEPASGITFSELVEAFFKDHIEAQNIGPRPYNRIKNHLQPVFANYPADGISSDAIESFMRGKRQAGTKERTLADSIRFTCMMYDWGVNNFLCKTKPFENYRLKRESNNRKKFYSMLELRTLLINPDNLSLNRDFYLIQKGLILSGCRRSELIKAGVREFNFRNNYWTIPPERVKNQQKVNEADKEPFVIPMSDQLIALFREAIDGFGNDTHVFGSKLLTFNKGEWSKPSRGHLCERNFARYISSYREQYGIENRTNHDLRRTLETHLTNLGVSADITTAMTGHGREGMKGVYNQAQQIHILRTCFQLWADFLDFICEKDERYALAYDDQTPSKELLEIYQTFNYNQRLIEALAVFG